MKLSVYEMVQYAENSCPSSTCIQFRCLKQKPPMVTLSSSSRKDLVSGSFLRLPCSLNGHFYFLLASEFSGLIWFTMFATFSFYPIKFRLCVGYTLESMTFLLFHIPTNGNFSLRVPRLYIRNVITFSPFFFKTLIFQANKQTAFCLAACDICQVSQL